MATSLTQKLQRRLLYKIIGRKMKISLIVAAATNNAIGINNTLPWHLPQDLRYFKATTMGKPIIMGRKTFESIGKPLPGRLNIVMTRQPNWQFDGVCVAKSFAEAKILAESVFLNDQNDNAEIMVIGGAELYNSALPIADRIYLTRVDVAPQGDAFFPEISEMEWLLTSDYPGEEDAPFSHRFMIFDRIG